MLSAFCRPSVLAKFLVYLGEGAGRAEMGEGIGIGEESGEGRTRGGKWQCAKKYPKTQQIWHLETPLNYGGYRPVSHIFGKLLSGTTSQNYNAFG